MFNKINIPSTDFIGNTLSSMNLNYSNMEYWTNSIITSSQKFYEPLVNFYLFYGDFWKDSINFAYSIDAPNRLSSFYTNVETNSSLWIDPFVFFYPQINLSNTLNKQNSVTNVVNWMNEKFPVLTSNNSNPNYIEKTVAIVYVMFYTENTRVPRETVVIEQQVPCSTNDVTVTVTCRQYYSGNVSCGASSNVCGEISPRVCSNTKTATCNFENNLKSITRKGIANIDIFFNDRSEDSLIQTIKLVVKNCTWQFEKLL